MVDVDTGDDVRHLSVYPGECGTEHAKPAFVERALIVPGVNPGGLAIFINQVPFRAELTLARFIGVERLPAFLPFEMPDAAIRGGHRRIGI